MVRVRTFRGSQINSVIERIREEVGPEAVILSTNDVVGEMGRIVEVRVEVESDVNPVQMDSSQRTRYERQAQRTLTSGSGEVDRGVLYQSLQEQGVKPNLLEELLLQVERNSQFPQGEVMSQALAECIGIDSQVPSRGSIVALIGPAGVGKTTSVAKLAAKLQAALNLKIGLVSLDGTRIAASYQLQSYASILRLPFATLAKDTLLDQELTQLNYCDMVLVDTPGINSAAIEQLEELATRLGSRHRVEKMLVLAAPCNDRDLRNVVTGYGRVGFERVLLTKVDESCYIGPVLNVLADMQKPLAFIGTGQNVPDDIEPASLRRLAWLLTRSIH